MFNVDRFIALSSFTEEPDVIAEFERLVASLPPESSQSLDEEKAESLLDSARSQFPRSVALQRAVIGSEEVRCNS